MRSINHFRWCSIPVLLDSERIIEQSFDGQRQEAATDFATDQAELVKSKTNLTEVSHIHTFLLIA